MDSRPFLTINFEKPEEDLAEQLYRFHYEQLEPNALRALAKENMYLSDFRKSITESLRDCDLEFVRYVAAKAGIERTFTGKFLESIQPIVKQATALSISSLVTSSLTRAEAVEPPPVEVVPDDDAPVVDPDNTKIITTIDERRLFEICCDILQDEDLSARDTETYFSVIYGGRSNRWLLRFYGDKKRPAVQFIEPITEVHRAEAHRAGLDVGSNGQILLDKPENLYRLAGIVRDSLAYCKDDENFRRGSRVGL